MQLMKRAEHISLAASALVLESAADPALLDRLTLVLDMLTVGILLLSEGARIFFANDMARTILERGDLLTLRHGRLRARTLEANKSLNQHVNAAIANCSQDRHNEGSIVSLRSASGRLVVALICSCKGTSSETIAEPAAVMFVSDPELHIQPDEHQVARVYGLTPAEERLLSALIEGDRLSKYADDAGITLNTAKGYLKQLFRKTSTSRQADLLRLILSNPVLRLASRHRTVIEACMPRPKAELRDRATEIGDI